MRTVVFGSTGGTGRQIVRQACEAGHEVTAVVRDPSRMEERSELLTVVPADVLDPGAVEPVVRGVDVVVSAIGSRAGLSPTTVQTDSTRSIVEAMRRAGTRRLVVISNSGMITTGDGPLSRFVAKPLLRRVFRHPWADMWEMEETLRTTELDWTIVRPPMLTDGAPTRDYRTAVERNVRGGTRVSRANVARCVLGCIDDEETVGRAVAVAN